MHPRVAPVAVEIELAEDSARAGQFEQLVGGEQRDLGGQDLGFGDGDRGRGGGLRVFVAEARVDGFSRAA